MSISSAPLLSSLAKPNATTAPGLIAYGAKAPDPKAKARAVAVDFEASFLNSMFNQMFTAMEGDGPFGGSKGVGVWRSFLSEQYAKSFAKAGGVGIADHVYRSLIAQQETHSGVPNSTAPTALPAQLALPTRAAPSQRSKP